MFVIVGLGNPGREYEKTRHNAGFMTLDAIADKLGVSVTRKGFRSVYGECRVGSERVVLAKPETFMNNSGFAVSDLLNWYKPDHDHLLVIYDDIDLPCGGIRIRSNGSAGTHNGMRSIDEQLGFEDFPRIRIGIGKPEHGLIDHVLGVPCEEDAKKLREAFSAAAEAALMIVRGRIDEAQTKFNYKPPKKEKPRKNGHEKHDPLCCRPSEDVSLLGSGAELFYKNKELLPAKEALGALPYSMADVLGAEARLARFAPLIARLFPETAENGGVIESPLVETPTLLKALVSHSGAGENAQPGGLFIKLDSLLAVAGSVKARGGIYEVLKHTETLAIENGLLKPGDDYSKLADCRGFFSNYTIQVGSTGNLGLSIGISGAAIGYKTIVHMSADAKQWKKDLLRSKGVTVIEYASDYSEAVKQGRALSDADPKSYFVDDENSLDLFMGYAVAALRLDRTLRERGIVIDERHPLCCYLPCGVGGAPGGITFGLKLLYGDNAHCYFIEPVNAPCMLAALTKGECVHISELGLSGKTDADGLAVGAASKLVYSTCRHLISGEFTVDDSRLTPFVRIVHSTEHLFIEPSAAASLAGYIGLIANGAPKDAVHILWATGGGLVPEEERRRYI